MIKLMNCIAKNWIAISVALILTRLSVEYAYIERGYMAIGSEWMIFPLTLFLFNAIRKRAEFARKLAQNMNGGK